MFNPEFFDSLYAQRVGKRADAVAEMIRIGQNRIKSVPPTYLFEPISNKINQLDGAQGGHHFLSKGYF